MAVYPRWDSAEEKASQQKERQQHEFEHFSEYEKNCRRINSLIKNGVNYSKYSIDEIATNYNNMRLETDALYDKYTHAQIGQMNNKQDEIAQKYGFNSGVWNGGYVGPLFNDFVEIECIAHITDVMTEKCLRKKGILKIKRETMIPTIHFRPILKTKFPDDIRFKWEIVSLPEEYMQFSLNLNRGEIIKITSFANILIGKRDPDLCYVRGGLAYFNVHELGHIKVEKYRY